MLGNGCNSDRGVENGSVLLSILLATSVYGTLNSTERAALVDLYVATSPPTEPWRIGFGWDEHANNADPCNGFWNVYCSEVEPGLDTVT